ncbi:MAG: PIG-L family deacetylase [Nanoarchaeota archaeon]|nr:PIG-L family deacetylase [Nanoarchaeota archaeon]MBU1135224.1 PIG-L family deacetylase [Nanoarchaeota archaeon]MBU2519859.1 PIG-L family deacetylase [Nanoarchaeota archaeon]
MFKEFYTGKTVLLAPHQDDESIGAFCLMKRISDNNGKIYVVFATNGAPEGIYPFRSGDIIFDNQEQYAHTRKHESLRVLNKIGLEDEHIRFLGITDRTLYLNLEKTECMVKEIIEELEPDRILVCSNEKCHPDHDSLKAAAFIASRSNKKDLWEYATYNASGKENNIYEKERYNIFADGIYDFELMLTDEEITLKKEAFSLYESQITDILSRFTFEKESFRRASTTFFQPKNIQPHYEKPDPDEVDAIIMNYINSRQNLHISI